LIIGVEVLFLYLFKYSFLIVQKQLFPEEAWIDNYAIVSITLKPSEVSRMFSCLVHRGGSCGHNIPGLGRCPLNQKLCSQLVAV
jgi:hypothetical protein